MNCTMCIEKSHQHPSTIGPHGKSETKAKLNQLPCTLGPQGKSETNAKSKLNRMHSAFEEET